MEKLQYAALRKCTGAVVVARKEYVRKIAAVEGLETFARAAACRFLAQTMCDPVRAGVAENGDVVMAGVGELSLGGELLEGGGDGGGSGGGGWSCVAGLGRSDRGREECLRACLHQW